MWWWCWYRWTVCHVCLIYTAKWSLFTGAFVAKCDLYNTLSSIWLATKLRLTRDRLENCVCWQFLFGLSLFDNLWSNYNWNLIARFRHTIYSILPLILVRSMLCWYSCYFSLISFEFSIGDLSCCLFHYIFLVLSTMSDSLCCSFFPLCFFVCTLDKFTSWLLDNQTKMPLNTFNVHTVTIIDTFSPCVSHGFCELHIQDTTDSFQFAVNWYKFECQRLEIGKLNYLEFIASMQENINTTTDNNPIFCLFCLCIVFG